MHPPLERLFVLLLVDGLDHANAAKPLLAPLFTTTRDEPTDTGAGIAVSSMGDAESADASAVTTLVITGGIRGTCTDVLRLVKLPPNGCHDRRFRVTDLHLGRDAPGNGLAIRLGSGVARRSMWHAAETMLDLSQLVRTSRPSAILSINEPPSPAARALSSLGALGGPPRLCLTLNAPAWALRVIGSLSPTTLGELAAIRLTIIVTLSLPTLMLETFRASIERVALLPAAVTAGSQLTLLLAHNSRAGLAASAHAWPWPVASKHVRYRINQPSDCAATVGTVGTLASATVASRELRRVIEQVEAWMPTLGMPRADYKPEGNGDGGWGLALILGDGVELSEGFLVYVHRLLCTLIDETTPASRLLGIALGSPERSNVRVNSGDRLAQAASSCGTVYFGSAWSELRKFASAHFRAHHTEACRTPATAPLAEGWGAVQSQFMLERGYGLRFPPQGLCLCRRQGETAPLARGDEVEAALALGNLPRDPRF